MRVWDYVIYLWFDFVDVRLVLLLLFDVIECICFFLGNMFLFLLFLFVKIIYDYSFIVNFRFKFFFDFNMNCFIRCFFKLRGEGFFIYCILVFIGDWKKVGINVNVMLIIIGKIW